MTEATAPSPPPKFKCEKCGRPYERGGKWMEKHVAGCDGTPWTPDQKPTRSRAPAAPSPEPEPAPPPPPPTPAEFLLIAARDLREQKIERRATIQTQLDAMQLEIDELTRSISALESVKTIVDKSLVTADCGNCNSTIDQLKTAQWDAFDAKNQRAEAKDDSRRLSLWINETVRLMRLKIRIPTQDELKRQYPMLGEEPRPPAPRTPDPRTAPAPSPAPAVQP